jgi:predicted nucleic acid-binding protein
MSNKAPSRPTLIDTSAWILALRKECPTFTREEVDHLIAENRAATAGIIALELLSGTRTEREYRELKEDLEALIQLEIPCGLATGFPYLPLLDRRGLG